MLGFNNKIKRAEVLIASTIPIVWETVKKSHITSQKMNSADADYIAFFRVQLNEGKNIKSAITHIAKVKSSDNNALLKDFFKRNPDILKYSEEKGKLWEKKKYHKEYYIEEIKKLQEPILCRKGEGRRCQVKLYTTMSELKKAKFLGDIKTISQIIKTK